MTKKKSSARKNVLLIHTGGTFGMAKGKPHLSRGSSREYLSSLFTRIPELSGIANLDLKILCNIDSSDMTAEVWSKLAELICKEWNSFDGFVVIHGTDTMAYTACALSYFLQGLSKPVVLTGSQLPLSELRSDARANIIDSIELATLGFPEVMICFDSKVHRGTRASKFNNEHLQAFRSINAAPLGHFGVHFNINKKMMRRAFPELNRPKPQCDSRIESNVACIDCAPGIELSDDLMDALIRSVKGIVLTGFGTGNLPLIKTSWLKLCKRALAKRVPVVMASHSTSGRIQLELYENGRAFETAGVISGEDMSLEAMTLKLMVMLGRKIRFEKRHEFFSTALSMECSREDKVTRGEEL